MGVLKVMGLFVLLVSFTGIQAQDDNIISSFKSSYTNESNGDFSKAIEDLTKVYSENSYPINLRLAWLSYSAGNFTKSIAYYSKAINLMPYSIEAKLGITYPASAVGNWNLVEESYKKVLEIEAKNYTANYKLASIYYGRKDFSSANKYLQIIVNLYPFNYDTTILYAWTNLQLGKNKEATILFNKALMLSPNSESAKEGLELLKK
jgi:tetratricopeptide (TPR) repeat protein